MTYTFDNLPKPGETGDRTYHECVAEAVHNTEAGRGSTVDKILEGLKKHHPEESDLQAYIETILSHVRVTLQEVECAVSMHEKNKASSVH